MTKKVLIYQKDGVLDKTLGYVDYSAYNTITEQRKNKIFNKSGYILTEVTLDEYKQLINTPSEDELLEIAKKAFIAQVNADYEQAQVALIVDGISFGLRLKGKAWDIVKAFNVESFQKKSNRKLTFNQTLSTFKVEALDGKQYIANVRSEILEELVLNLGNISMSNWNIKSKYIGDAEWQMKGKIEEVTSVQDINNIGYLSSMLIYNSVQNINTICQNIYDNNKTSTDTKKWLGTIRQPKAGFPGQYDYHLFTAV